jgi:hypothetical protein
MKLRLQPRTLFAGAGVSAAPGPLISAENDAYFQFKNFRE